MNRFLFSATTASILCGIIYYSKINPTLDFISKLFEISLVVSSILFGVLGIWLSSIYNDGLKNFLSEDSDIDLKRKSENEIKKLLYPLLFSFLAVSISLFYFTSLIFKDEILKVVLDIFLLKRIALFFYIFITFFQISFLTIIFEPLVDLYTDLWFKTKGIEDDDQIFNKNKGKLK